MNSVQLAAFINAPPRVFKSCTAPEMNMIAGLSVLVFLLVAMLSWLLLGNLPLATGIGTCFAFIAFQALIHSLAALKKSKPQNHYMLLMLKWSARLKLRSTVVVHTGNWRMTRRLIKKRGA